MLAISEIAGVPRQGDDPEDPMPFWRQGAVINITMMKRGIEAKFDWTTNLGRFPHKVLFLHGERSGNHPLEHQKELASHYASSELITLAGTGHHHLWEKQKECLAHIRAYLAEIGVAQSASGGAR